MNNNTLQALQGWVYNYARGNFEGHEALVAYLIKRRFPDLGSNSYVVDNIHGAFGLMQAVPIPNLTNHNAIGLAAADDILQNHPAYADRALEAYNTYQRQATMNRDTQAGLQGQNSNLFGDTSKLPKRG